MSKFGTRAGIEEGAVGRIAIVEDVVDAAIDLERLVELIGGVGVEDGIATAACGLIGFVADEILAADEQRVAANLERVGDE